jgi:hypothetical protein
MACENALKTFSRSTSIGNARFFSLGFHASIGSRQQHAHAPFVRPADDLKLCSPVMSMNGTQRSRMISTRGSVCVPAGARSKGSTAPKKNGPHRINQLARRPGSEALMGELLAEFLPAGLLYLDNEGHAEQAVQSGQNDADVDGQQQIGKHRQPEEAWRRHVYKLEIIVRRGAPGSMSSVMRRCAPGKSTQTKVTKPRVTRRFSWPHDHSDTEANAISRISATPRKGRPQNLIAQLARALGEPTQADESALCACDHHGLH